MDCPFLINIAVPKVAFVGVAFRFRFEILNTSQQDLTDLSLTFSDSGESNATWTCDFLRPNDRKAGNARYCFAGASAAGVDLWIRVKSRGLTESVWSGHLPMLCDSEQGADAINVTIAGDVGLDENSLFGAQALEGIDVSLGHQINVEGDGLRLDQARQKAELAGFDLQQELAVQLYSWKPVSFSIRGIEFRGIEIPQNGFRMGADFQLDPQAERTENPRMIRFATPFWIGQQPVTVGEYHRIMGSDAKDVLDRIRDDPRKKKHRDAKAPITYISWDEARRFCERLTDIAAEDGFLPENYIYRLPTEAEWEYCCRAGTAGPRYSTVLDSIAWTASNSGKEIKQAGLLQPNEFGLYDTLGLVYEWCLDEYREFYPAATMDPFVLWKDETDGFRVCRGGSFNLGEEMSRASARGFKYCSERTVTSQGSESIEPPYRGMIGFRVILAVPKS